jgi:hypothetical protein
MSTALAMPAKAMLAAATAAETEVRNFMADDPY